VWRVSWNISGTVLASTADDGATRLWKADYNNQYHQILATQAIAGNNPTTNLPNTTINNSSSNSNAISNNNPVPSTTAGNSSAPNYIESFAAHRSNMF
jgi:hypothetical protein